jgi:hypothetical protein
MLATEFISSVHSDEELAGVVVLAAISHAHQPTTIKLESGVELILQTNCHALEGARGREGRREIGREGESEGGGREGGREVGKVRERGEGEREGAVLRTLKVEPYTDSPPEGIEI